MIHLRPAKSVHGKVELPVSPDLLLMAALGACAAGRAVNIIGVNETDVVGDVIRSLKGHASIDHNESILKVSPVAGGDEPALLLTLPESLIPYRVIYLFMGLGMGKAVLMRSASQRQLHDFIAQAKRVGIAVESVDIDGLTALKATGFDSGIAETSYPDESDCAALLAFLFGKGEKLTFAITDYHLSIPLRQLSTAFGFILNAKQTGDDGTDPLAKRMRFLKGRRRDAAAQNSLTFTVETDFSRRDAKSPTHGGADGNGGNTDNNAGDALNIVIPGDEILAAALVTLKCIIPKGDFEISNAPLESWASQAVSFIKKMGCKVNAKDGAKTAFGSCGTITVQKSEYAGRKIRCTPIYQYIGQLPCMTVAAAFSESKDSKSVFRELGALRLFEPDGLDTLEKCLRPLGIRHGEMPDGIVVEGAKEFDGFDMIEPLPAHIAVAFCMAGLRCVGKTSVADEFILSRWPDFETLINEICEFRAK